MQLDHAKNIADSDEIQNEIDPLRSLSLALRKDGEVIRQTYIRVYCYAATRDQLERKVNEVVKQIRKMSLRPQSSSVKVWKSTRRCFYLLVNSGT